MSLLLLLGGEVQQGPRQASLSQTLGVVTLASSAGLRSSASLAQQLGAITLDAAAATKISAALARGLGEIGLQSAANVRIGASLGVTLDAVAISAYAGQIVETRSASLEVTLGDIHLYAYVGNSDAAPAQAPATRVGRGVLVVKKGRRKPSFIGVPDQPPRVVPPVTANPITANVNVTLGDVQITATASMGEAPAARRRRLVAAALLLH